MRHTLALAALLLLAGGPPAAASEEPAATIERARAESAAGNHEAALQALRTALEAHPEHPAVLLELGRVSWAQAREILASAAPTLWRLAAFDAMNWLRRAVAAAPEDRAALALLGEIATEMQEYGTGADAWSRVAALDPGDGEARYQQGFCLALLLRFEEAIRAFDEAERILGPDPRIRLNRGICHFRLGRTGEAQSSFLDLLLAEEKAGRRGGEMMKAGLKWLWQIRSEAGTPALAAEAFGKLTAAIPDLAGGWWYLGHARLAGDDAAAAAAAFAKVTELQPGWADGWRQLGETLIRAGRAADAGTAVDRLVELDPEGSSGPDLAVAVVDAILAGGKPEEAIALLDRLEPKLPGDAVLIEKRGDAKFRAGRMAEAIRDWRAAAERDPFADSVLVKAEKAATRLKRAGEAPEGLGLRGPAPAAAADSGPEQTLFDFEEPGVFARTSGNATGARSGGTFRLTRTAGESDAANLGLTLIPEIDTRPYSALRFTVKGPAGKWLLVTAKDNYDQFEPQLMFVRLLHRTPVLLTGERQVVSLPLDGFVARPPRALLPMNRAGLRAIYFEIGAAALAPDVTLAEEILVDDVALVAEDGSARVLEDFEGPARETLFLSTGEAMAFARTLGTPDQIPDFRPDANTYVRPNLFGEEFDPADVHSGQGSFRLTLPRPGEAAGSLEFNPDRSVEEATRLSFWAKGRVGGERLRVVFRDALDDDLANDAPASAPRIETPAHLLEGCFELSPEWKRYDVPRSALPDVDFRSLLRIEFRFGTPEGNAPGTTIYLDEIGT